MKKICLLIIIIVTGIFLYTQIINKSQYISNSGIDQSIQQNTANGDLVDTQSENNVIKYNGKITPENVIQIYAHRAGRGLMPEHTLPAYRGVLELGVDYVDMDINMTKDGVLVITHDLGLNPYLTRDSLGRWITTATPINTMTLNEVQKYNVGKLKPYTEYGSFFPHQHPSDFAKIPTLEEVIQYVKNITGDKVGFQIEIKNNPEMPDMSATPTEYAEALYELLKEEGVLNRTEIQAFDWRCLIALQKLDPNVKTAYLTDQSTETLVNSDPGTLIAGLKPKDFGYSFPKMIKHLGGYCWEPFEMDIIKKDVEEAHKLGLKVVVWGWPEMEKTEFNYKQIEEVIDWGVDGIIVDRPDILKGVLTARGYNLPVGFTIADNNY